MVKQRTLKQIARAVGIGLHSGTKVKLALRPAAADTGVVFRRVDVDPPVDIPLTPENVVDTRMATTIGRGDIRSSDDRAFDECAGGAWYRQLLRRRRCAGNSDHGRQRRELRFSVTGGRNH
jgi:UDP-3-O-[3-hydroxymyristoyl] N-acetylglucosamine deacetylase